MDNHSTTRTDPRVVKEMMPFFSDTYGNPSSRTHIFGWKAEDTVDISRKKVAQIIGAKSSDIIFTSGASESNNIAIFGVSSVYQKKGKHIITQITEHKSVLECFYVLEKKGFKITYLPVDKKGYINLNDLEDAICDDTILVSIMHINNEIGTIQPLEEIGSLCKKKNILFHTDATQSIGKLLFDINTIGADLVSFSSHKLYGPKGIGALYIRRRNPRVKLKPFIYGGGHEKALRSGTLNVPAIVGFGFACELASLEMDTNFNHLKNLSDILLKKFESNIDDFIFNGDTQYRHPGNLNISFRGIDSETLLLAISNIALSSGSACSSLTLEPSYVLLAIGRTPEETRNSIRFGLGRYNTIEEVNYVADIIIKKIKQTSQKYNL